MRDGFHPNLLKIRCHLPRGVRKPQARKRGQKIRYRDGHKDGSDRNGRHKLDQGKTAVVVMRRVMAHTDDIGR